MHCPRCGFFNDPEAHTCGQCGVLLRPLSMFPQQANGAGDIPAEGHWREDVRMGPSAPQMPPSPQYGAPEPPQPAWLADALRDANAGQLPGAVRGSAFGSGASGPGAGGAGPSNPSFGAPSMGAARRGFGGPPQLMPTNGSESSLPPGHWPSAQPPMVSGPAVSMLGSGGLGQMPPMPSVEGSFDFFAPGQNGQPMAFPGGNESMAVVPSSAFGAWAPADNRAAMAGPYAGGPAPMGSVGVPALRGRTDLQSMADANLQVAQALGPGTLLKGGRYRLLERFYPTNLLQPMGNEPPLMIASDTEMPNGRVLVQELLLNSVRPEDTENVRRLIAQRMLALAHVSGMPKLLDHFSERRRHFMIHELPTGDALLDRVQRGRAPLDERTAVGYILQALDTLAAFEREQPPFIHGNLCPANIIVRPGGQVTLVGMSSTLLLHPDGHLEGGAAGGIPGYAAPEQARGHANSRCDLFALCAVLHHITTGVAPAPRPNAMYQPARRLNPNLSLELEEVLGRGLRPSATQRFQSVSELRQALAPLAAGRVTLVPDDLRADGLDSTSARLAPVRDARGRLVLPRKRAAQNPFILLGSILALVVLVGGGVLFALSPHGYLSGHVAPTATPNRYSDLFQQNGVALSGGEFIFDAQRPNNDLKQQGARALASSRKSLAQEDFRKAFIADPSDAEAAIYEMDLQILAEKVPYVTVVAAVAFGADDLAARAELQGIYLAQARANTFALLPYNVHVRVLVLNSGSAPDGAATAANVLLDEIHRGNAQHLVGIVGWPESEQSRLAISALRFSGLALISPTATSDTLGSTAISFFSLAASDTVQTTELADSAVKQLNARRILVLSNPAVATSVASAKTFTDHIDSQYGTKGVRTDRATFTTDAQTDFDVIVRDAIVNRGDSVIYLAGTDQDAVRLARSVTALNAYYNTSIRVLTPSSTFTPALLGIGDSPVAKLVQENPAALASLYITSLADASDWQQVHTSRTLEPATFATDYSQQFGTLAEPSGLPNPDATSILSYDATRLLFAAGTKNIHGSSTNLTYPTPIQMRNEILQFTADNPFLGVGGALAFDGSGRLPLRAFSIDALTPLDNPAPGKPVVSTTLFAIAGGQSLFCLQSECKPN